MKKIKFTDCVDLVGSSCRKFDGTKVYVSTGAVDTDHIDQADIEIVDFDNKPSRANLIVNTNDILFAKMQATTKTLYIDEDLSENIYSTGFCAVRAKNNIITNKCLYYLLTSDTFLGQKDKNCSGATQKAITNTGLGKIEILIPAIAQQTELVEQLDAVCDLISYRKQQLAVLDKLISSRFAEMFGDPVHNEKEWIRQPLNDICTIIVDCPHSTPSYTYEDTGFMCIRTSIVKKNQILWDEIEYIPENEYLYRIQRKKPEKGDVIYTREGAILGIAAVIDKDCNVAMGQRMMLLSPDLNQCNPHFLSVAMNCKSFLDNALKGIIGSASPHINVGDIKEFEMILPPIELQNEFATFMCEVEQLKSDAKEALSKLETLKKSLMQKYFG